MLWPLNLLQHDFPPIYFNFTESCDTHTSSPADTIPIEGAGKWQIQPAAAASTSVTTDTQQIKFPVLRNVTVTKYHRINAEYTNHFK